ncbi:MAG TPA: ATP-dependent DNA helicase RecG [Syntrophales bacterium]|nr:ATP-dependent DNA helicase RecG [Syntrophales bacterium]
MNAKDAQAGTDGVAMPVRYVKGVGPKTAALLEKKGVRTVEDLLYFAPIRYEDRRRIDRVSEITETRRAVVVGVVRKASAVYYRRVRVFEAVVDDGSGQVVLKWFRGNDSYLRWSFRPGRKIIFFGELKVSPFGKEMAHPDFETIDEGIDDENLHFGRSVPVYSETEGLQQKQLRRVVRNALDTFSQCVGSPIPAEIRSRRGLADIPSALKDIHFPAIDADVGLYNERKSLAHRSLVFDELFFFQLALALKKGVRDRAPGIAFRRRGKLVESFFGMLPFELTAAQRRVFDEVEKDMSDGRPMQRLLQGDVGCGKTVIAMAAVLRAVENGYQGAVMAPTEILAVQHHQNMRRWAEPLGLRIGLLTGSLSKKDRLDTLDRVASGRLDIVIGTHALIQDHVSFKGLGLVVIDEQHRFGVAQRQKFTEKGANPDVLVMTATPIPRTLAMTVYGDLDVSVIDEMPRGRARVKTKVFSERQRDRVYEIVRSEVAKGGQAFVVYPLVAGSETLDLRDATRMAGHLQRDVFPGFRVGLVHGRMKGEEKERIMSEFSGGGLDILVSTTVVEVGIDVPQASLMVIEHAERFGLSQLHQLRGRVGRGNRRSYCILMASSTGTKVSSRRLRVMEETNDGFLVAEEDLAIRGPGEFMGTRQSGLPEFRVANIFRDLGIMDEAREDAFSVIERDPGLARPENEGLYRELMRRWSDRIGYAKTG